jgi:CubicO group peptidase (beta-lactamase class C family)
MLFFIFEALNNYNLKHIGQIKAIGVLLLNLFISTIVFGQSKQEKNLIKQLDAYVSTNYQRYAPGCAVLVAKHGNVIFEKGFGSANLELDVPVRPESVFRIGSITKQFTAVAILQLVEKGKIALNDSVQKFIKNYHSKGKTIRIENLLSHTSGIKGYEELDAKLPNAIRVDFSADALIDSLDKLPLDFVPRSQYQYSNSNYFLLGKILEVLSGKSYQSYLKEQIFSTLGLNSTYYDNPEELIKHRVSGYSSVSGEFKNAGYISMSTVYSAGALLSNVKDLYRWHQALNNGELLKNETWKQVISPFKLNDGKLSDYGFGFFIKNENNVKSIGHGGAIDGFRAVEIYYPQKDLYIVLLCNSEQDNFTELFSGISQIVSGNGVPAKYKDIKIAEEQLDTYIGNYTFLENPQQSIQVYKKEGRLYADLSNKSGLNMAMLGQTETLFYLPDVIRIPTTIEFIVTNGKVTGLFWTQEQKHEAKRN